MLPFELAQRRQRMAVFIVIWFVFTAAATAIMFSAFTNTPEPNLDLLPTQTPPSFEGLAASLTPDPRLSPPPAINAQFDLGVTLRETQPNVDSSVMAGYMGAASDQLNLNWVRFQIRWDFIEPQQGQFNWANWDQVFALATEYKLAVLVNVLGSPAWARPPESDPNLMGPPHDPQLFADFVQRLLRRYPNQIHALEIWADINERANWDSVQGLQPDDYLALLRPSAQIIRRIDPDILIVSGALEPTGGIQDESIDDFIYMDGLLAGGLLELIDCFGAQHIGYNVPPNIPWDAIPSNPNAIFGGPFLNPHHSWSFYSTLNTYARKIAAAGYTTPLCVTRFGWGTAQDLVTVPPEIPFTGDNSLQDQAEWIMQAINLMQSWGFVRLAFIWNLNSGPEAGFDTSFSSVAYSLIRPNYTFAPVWHMIAALDFREQAAPPETED